MSLEFTAESYKLQAKKRLDDPQVGYLLKDIYNMEQILITNYAQFRKFYRLWKGYEFPDDLTVDEVNRNKVEVIKEIMEDMVRRINGGVYSREGANI